MISCIFLRCGITKSLSVILQKAFAVASITVGVPDALSVQQGQAHASLGYDMEYEGGFYATNTFIRNMAWAATGARVSDP